MKFLKHWGQPVSRHLGIFNSMFVMEKDKYDMKRCRYYENPRAFRQIMGDMMGKVRGKIDGKIVSEVIEQCLKK